MKTALIIGGSQKVMEEAAFALTLFTPDATFVVNDMIPKWPDATYICSVHPDKLSNWIEQRVKAGHKKTVEVWSHRRVSVAFKAYHDITHITNDWNGSSGLFAVRVALLKKFDRIVCAGIPMSSEAGHIIRKRHWPAVVAFRDGWTNHIKELKPFVRSCSGWTRELLGYPTKNWIGGGND